MRFETVACPQCGGPLESVDAPGFYACPYCRSRIHVTFSHQDPNRRADGRLTVHDAGTGEALCHILLPRGWMAEGRLYPAMQSANWPLTLAVTAWAPDREAIIEYRSGAAFKDVQSGLAGHREGQFDQADLMPMRRLVTPLQYVDQIFGEMSGLAAGAFAVESRPLPQEPPIDYTSRAQAMKDEMEGQLRAFTPPGMWSRVDAVYYDGATRIYDYSLDGQAIRLAIATLIDGTRISAGGGGLFFTPAASYISWESQYVLSLRSAKDRFEDFYPDLTMFCSSMEATPQMIQRFASESCRITGQLQQRQSDWFHAHMRMMEEQRARFEAYNQAWFADSDRRHRARQRTASEGPALDRVFEKYGEAVRGVDTYLRPDGTEVEYSVVNEAAFASTTDSRTTFATQQRDFQSIDWVEMKKKD